jgi:hypothetical protein
MPEEVDMTHTNTLNSETHQQCINISPRLSEELCVSFTETNRLILFMCLTALYCEYHIKKINTLCVQSEEVSTVSKHCALTGGHAVA